MAFLFTAVEMSVAGGVLMFVEPPPATALVGRAITGRLDCYAAPQTSTPGIRP